eukprot:24665_5
MRSSLLDELNLLRNIDCLARKILSCQLFWTRSTTAKARSFRRGSVSSSLAMESETSRLRVCWAETITLWLSSSSSASSDLV